MKLLSGSQEISPTTRNFRSAMRWVLLTKIGAQNIANSILGEKGGNWCVCCLAQRIFIPELGAGFFAIDQKTLVKDIFLNVISYSKILGTCYLGLHFIMIGTISSIGYSYKIFTLLLFLQEILIFPGFNIPLAFF